MNIQSKPPLTAGEQALSQRFEARRADLPGSAATTELRESLIGQLLDRGLPTRRIEAWHYTDLRMLLRDVPEGAAARGARPAHALVGGAAVLSPAGDGTASLPQGVSVAGFAERLASGALSLSPRGDDDAIGQINGAFADAGLQVTIADNAKLAVPLELQAAHGGGQGHLRNEVSVGANASATIIERHLSDGSGQGFVSAVTDLTVGAEANVSWVVVQGQGASDTHLGQINVRLEQDARLTLCVVNAGGKLVRQEIHVVTVGEGADFKLRGVNLLGGDSHTDVTMTLGHDVPNTTSTEILRNVVFDRARGVFQGQIRVAPNAQKTDARMASNTLLLSDEGEFATKPELEIFADDVQCAHGATVADFDAVHLFYMMSRGIPETVARRLLVQAFVNEVVDDLDDEALSDALHSIIESWLEKHV